MGALSGQTSGGKMSSLLFLDAFSEPEKFAFISGLYVKPSGFVLQVPQAELETWLVQRDHDPLPAGLPVQASQLAREPPGMERVQLAPSLESRPPLATLHEEADDEEEENEEVQFH